MDFTAIALLCYNYNAEQAARRPLIRLVADLWSLGAGSGRDRGLLAVSSGNQQMQLTPPSFRRYPNAISTGNFSTLIFGVYATYK